MKKFLSIILVITIALASCIPLTGCDKDEVRENGKQLLKDVFKALPVGLKEAKEKVLDPAIENAKQDAKEIYDDVKPSWDAAFPKDEATETDQSE